MSPAPTLPPACPPGEAGLLDLFAGQALQGFAAKYGPAVDQATDVSRAMHYAWLADEAYRLAEAMLRARDRARRRAAADEGDDWRTAEALNGRR